MIGAIWMVKSGKAGQLGRTYGPPLMEAVQRHTDGQLVFSQAVVPLAVTQVVRAELQGWAAFAEVTRGRYVLGKPSGYKPEPLLSA